MLFSSSLRVLLAGLLAGAAGLAFARLPPEVYAALERAKVPPEALVVIVQEAGSTRTQSASASRKA